MFLYIDPLVDLLGNMIQIRWINPFFRRLIPFFRWIKPREKEIEKWIVRVIAIIFILLAMTALLILAIFVFFRIYG